MEYKYQQDCIGKKCNIMVEFSLFGDCNNIQKLSEELKLNATAIKRKEDCKIKDYAEDSWTISTGYRNVRSVASVFEELIDILRDKIDMINTIKKEKKLESIFIVVVNADADFMPEYVLTKDIIDYASRTKSEIHFDNYIGE